MSVEVKKLKQEFLRECLQKGWVGVPADQGWMERAGRERMDRWFRGLYELPCELPIPKERFLNHFSLGADPEFIFMTGGIREDARHLNLKAGLAFGADNNGRLVELRPAPSRSALGVLTSIWLTMHWLGAYVPQTPNYIWRAGAYVEADGLGGHIHFGRKQDRLRDRESRALDRIVHLLYTAGCYNRDEGRLRVRQAQGGGPQGYGRQSDIRLQPHGWEHRTFPSWLDTPWLGYLSLTLGKLAVASELMPQLVQEDGVLSAEMARAQIRLMLAFFKGVDDDARLALAILAQRGLPGHVNGGDLKVNWGIFNGPLYSQKVELPEVWPTSVPSVPELERELALSMLEGRLPEVGALRPTWSPHTLPEGYRQLIHDIPDTRLLPGIGEWTADVCYHNSRPVRVHTMNEGNRQFRFPRSWQADFTRKNLGPRLAQLNMVYDFCDLGGWEVMVGTSHGNIANMLEVRDLLIRHELLPIWPIAEVHPDSHERWGLPPDRKGSKALLKQVQTAPDLPPPPTAPPADRPADRPAEEPVRFVLPGLGAGGLAIDVGVIERAQQQAQTQTPAPVQAHAAADTRPIVDTEQPDWLRIARRHNWEVRLVRGNRPITMHRDHETGEVFIDEPPRPEPPRAAGAPQQGLGQLGAPRRPVGNNWLDNPEPWPWNRFDRPNRNG
jgi:hypothetical protein